MYSYSASTAPVRAPQTEVHASGGDNNENPDAATTSSAMHSEEPESGRTAWRRAGEESVRIRMEITLEMPASGFAPSTQPDWNSMARQYNDCYKLLRAAMHEKTYKGHEYFLGGSALLCFGLAYFASGRVPLSLKSISTVNLVASFLMQKLARSSSEMHRELKKTLISSGLEEEFIERLDSLEFTEEGLREAARLLQEKTPEDISDLADAFVKSYRQEPSVQKKVYALVQYITRTLGPARQ